jgi:hypothetical protein
LSGYLPLCAFRQGLLPETCRACAWWQTTTAQKSVDGRRQWMTALDTEWGAAGLLLQGSRIDLSVAAHKRTACQTTAHDVTAPDIAASIHFAPASSLPRLRELPLGSLPDDAILVFCLACNGSQPWYQPKRILHKALGHLRQRGVREVYSVASLRTGRWSAGGSHGVFRGSTDGDHCRFFPPGFLFANGYEEVLENGDLMLMRIDLGGLLTVFNRARAAVRQALGGEPAATPAAWVRGHSEQTHQLRDPSRSRRRPCRALGSADMARHRVL